MIYTLTDISPHYISRYHNDEDGSSLPTVLVSRALERKLDLGGICKLLPDYVTYMKKSDQSRKPETERDLEVYSTWEAGPDHVDLDNSQTFQNR